jgi:mono/diheme cytochrome c family protein
MQAKIDATRVSALLAFGLAAIVLAAHVHAADSPVIEQKPYRVVNGKVDESTYRGWQIYHSSCHTCHGVDAKGTQVAPSLIERMRDLSASDFTVKVLTSYRIVLDSNSAWADDSTAIRDAIVAEVLRRERGELVMPAWEGDSKVHPHLLDLYAYLKARSDGALGPGKPQRLAR